ncbi:hypothetical protein AAHZ94_34465 [Streptomyces sp. HSW2009]|uniref:hypothetical protein n=1 Tax=Streptomyces sp. HSW2009 TaxID=3142890 RepID=UPI0032EC499F
MKKKLALWLGGPVAAVTAVVAGTVIVAPAAHATPADCETFLRAHHYVVGQKVKTACKLAEGGSGVAKLTCKVMLKEIGVKSGDADTACSLSSK